MKKPEEFEPDEVDGVVRWNGQLGTFEPVMWKRAIIPYALYADEARWNSQLTVNAAGTVTPAYTYRVHHGAKGIDDGGRGNPMQITDLTFWDMVDTTAASAVTVTMRDMAIGRQFMNEPIHIRNMFGTSQLPGKLFEPLFVRSQGALELTFNKITGALTYIKPYLWGRMHLCWYQDLAGYPQDARILHTLVDKLAKRYEQVYPYWLTTDGGAVTVPASQSVEVDALVGDDGHFETDAWTYVATDARFTVEIFNPLTKQTIMNGAIQAGGSIGTAQNPQKLPIPWLIPQGQRLRFRFTDLSGSANTIYFTMRGRKVRAPLVDARATIERLKKESAA